MIEVEGLAREWGGFRLGELSLKVETGEYFAILGPCGCGKTLLLETIAGLHQPHEGDVLLNGQVVSHLAPEKRRIGIVYQQLALFPHLSVRENIAYGLRSRRMAPKAMEARVEDMLRLFRIETLADRSSPVGLSGGESQQVALARALAVEPEVLLLDEPLASLDSLSREHVSSILYDISRSVGVTTVHVTHDYTEAAALANRIAVMAGGQIKQVGRTDEIFWKPESRFVAEFLGVGNLLPGLVVRCGPHADVIRIGTQELAVPPTGLEGEVLCTIRPDEIGVSPNHTPATESSLEALVSEVRDAGLSVRLACAVDGVSIIVAVPRAQFRNLQCTVGDVVRLDLPHDTIHVFQEGG